MNITGIKLKGLNLVPSLNNNAFVTKHYLNADAVISQNTDTIDTDYVEKEISGFKNNMQLTAFVSPFHDFFDADKWSKTGLINGGIYFPTDRWATPGKTNAYDIIPDYNSETWTQSSIDAGFNVTLGASKSLKYPNHGQELFNISNGKYGYDEENDVPGQIDVFNPLAKYCKDWFYNLFGYHALTASFRNGIIITDKLMKNHFITVRNSIYDLNKYEHLNDLSKASTSRQGDMDVSMTRDVILQKVSEALESTISSGGWYSDFTHWHTAPIGEIDEYLTKQRTNINARNVFGIDFGLIAENKLINDSVEKIGSFEDASGLNIVVKINSSNMLINETRSSIFIRIDLTNTNLADKDITSNNQIIKLSTNIFLIEVNANKNGYHVVKLTASTSPEYQTLNIPTLASKGNNTVTLDKECQLVLYSVTSGQSINYAAVEYRSTNFSKVHNITTVMSGKDLYIGIIDKLGQSNLIRL